MRLGELFEKLDNATETDLSAIKGKIISTVQSLDNSKQSASILARVHNTLRHSSIIQDIQANLGGGMSEKFIGEISQTIFNGLAGFNEENINNFLDNLENDKVINTKALLLPQVQFSSVFSSAAGYKVFKALVKFGIDISRKGPGEFGLATLSNRIVFPKSGGGDLIIDGSLVEVKSALSAEAGKGGGRLGHQPPVTVETQRQVFDTFNQKYNNVMEHSRKSISAGKYIDLLNSRLPIGQKTTIGDKEYKNNALRYELSLPLISNIIGSSDGKRIATMISKSNDRETTLNEYYITQFNQYKAGSNWDRMLFFDLAADIAISMSNENEFRSAFEHIKILPPSIVPTQPNEVFAQLSLR
jgi:hypothetical protein